MTSSTFLNDLLTYESGIDEKHYDWYLDNWNKKSIDYFLITSPGNMIRDPATGSPIKAKLTVAEYFSTLGVLEYFDPTNIGSLRHMKYRSVNPWGFIGFQLGEQALAECGIYVPRTEEFMHEGATLYLNVSYTKVSDITWARGLKKKVLYSKSNSPLVIATDVNTWKGTFSGKYGIHSLSDLYIPEKQDLVVKNLINLNYLKLSSALLKHSIQLQSLEGKSWSADIGGHNKKLQVRFSISGMMACCHLCGHIATAGLLLRDEQSFDEVKTPILKYMHMFRDYDVSDLI